MPELIAYDDAPGDTASRKWIETTLGQRTLENVAGGIECRLMLLRAFRAGFNTRDAELNRRAKES